MAMVVWNPAPQDQLQIVVYRVASAEFTTPFHGLVENTRDYFNKCVPLYKLALKGDWKAARSLLDADRRLLNAAITKGWGTLLHAVAGTNHVHFVQELLNLLTENDLELKDYNGNTAFCFAAVAGNVRMAEIMLEKNGRLPTIRGGEGMTPLHMAALQGKVDMARYLFPRTQQMFQDDDDWIILFFLCINCDLHDLALQILGRRPMLALARYDYEKNETALRVLARKPSSFSCQGMKPNLALQLVKCLWGTLFSHNFSEPEMTMIISEQSQVIFDAAKVGNFEFLAELMNSYPDLIWGMDSQNRSIIHIAVLHRHASIFNLIHEVGSMKEVILRFEDGDENNLLHCAAKLAPPSQLNLISGAAFQMMHELLWFEEVKKLMQPLDIEKKNSGGQTPRELFTKEHEKLLPKAEDWMKNTSNSCMVVSTLITTGVFTAAFTTPGGYNDNTRTPNYLQKASFLVFAISDAIALTSSATSILIFLSILISRYAEDDFLKSLPLKLILGFVALFISIISMMVAFSSAFFIAYYHGLPWIPNFIAVLAFLPIPLFIYLQFPLWKDIVHSTYLCKSLFRPRKRMLC